MVNVSVRPHTVDGVRLDSLAWGITTISPTVGGLRTSDAELPGLDGVVASLNDPRDVGLLGLSMFVKGCDPDGLVPTNSMDLLESNLDELVHLFSKRHGLIDYQRQVNVGGTMRRAWCKVADAIAPELNPGRSAEFSVALQIPSGSWEDVANAADFSQANPVMGTAYEVLPLRGGTERINDAIFLVTGPITNPRITDTASGAYVQLNAVLAAGDTWRVNVGTWSSRTALAAGPQTLGSADTVGTDRTAVTIYGGTRGQVLYLPLTPWRISAGVRGYTVALSGTGNAAGTTLAARGKRRYLL